MAPDMKALKFSTEDGQSPLANPIQYQQLKEEELQRTSKTASTTRPSSGQTDIGGKADQEAINTCVQLLLCACSMGVEMCATFVQIFAVLYLQFLDVPMALVSLNGVLCGITSLLLLPFIGWFSERGTNPVIRKLSTMISSLLIYLLGTSGIALCGLLKMFHLQEMLDEGHNITKEDKGAFGNWSSSGSSMDFLAYADGVDQTPVPDTLRVSEPRTSTPYTAFLAIVCFAFLDIGFDFTMAMSRSFILECVPVFQHTRLLLMASIIHSVSGLAFALIATLDFSSYLASIFHVNGTAACIVFFAVFLATVVVVGFCCTMITGYVLLTRKKRKLDGINGNGKLLNVEFPTKASKESRLKRILWRRLARQSSPPDVLTTNIKRPLLIDNHIPSSRFYRSTSITAGAPLETVEDETGIATSLLEDDTISDVSLSASIEPSRMTEEEQTDSCQHRIDNYPQTAVGQLQGYVDESIPSGAISAFLASYSQSVTVAQSAFLRDTSLKMGSDRTMPPSYSNKPVPKTRLNKRLIILCVSAFLAIGSMLSNLSFTPNALTIGILHGDPSALPGTEAYFQYQRGLTNAAWGNFFMYVIYSLLSLCGSKIIDVLGEKLMFLISHLIFLSLMVSLVMAKTELLYFIVAAASGLQRMSACTLPYVLANKFTQSQEASSSMKRGQVMTLIGFLMPLHYLIMSAMMGPLMEATGNVWVPPIYSIVTATMGSLVFVLLYLVKSSSAAIIEVTA